MAKEPTKTQPPKTEEPKQFSDTELKDLQKNVSESLFSTTPRVPEAKPKEEKKEEKPPVVVPPAEEKKPVTEAKKPGRLEKLTRGISELTERVAESIKQKPEAKPEPEAIEEESGQLTPEDERDFDGFRKLEEINPKRKGIAERFKEFATARYNYEEEWKKANPEEEFNPDDKAHEKFFAKYPEFDNDQDVQEELEGAKIELRVDRRFDERVKPIEEKRRIEAIQQQTRPIVGAEVNRRVLQLVNQVSPELAKLLTDPKTKKLILNADNLSKGGELDPIAMDVLESIVMGEKDSRNQIKPETCLAYMLGEIEQMAFSDMTGFKLSKENPVHDKILKVVSDYEEAMKSAPAEVRFVTEKTKKGKELVKQFIPVSEFAELENQIRASKIGKNLKAQKLQELSDKYWTVGINEIEEIVIADAVEAANSKIKRLNGLVQKKSGKIPEEVKFSQPAIVPKPNGDTKPKPPTLLNSEVQSVSPGGEGGEKFGEGAAKILFG